MDEDVQEVKRLITGRENFGPGTFEFRESSILYVWQPELFGNGGEYIKHEKQDGVWKETERGRIADLNE